MPSALGWPRATSTAGRRRQGRACPRGDVYVAQIKVVFNPNGSLAARPLLLNPPTDPAWRPFAKSAMQAIKKCDPLHFPPQYAPYFDQWKVSTFHFDPRETHRPWKQPVD
jgi:hypothetical protein